MVLSGLEVINSFIFICVCSLSPPPVPSRFTAFSECPSSLQLSSCRTQRPIVRMRCPTAERVEQLVELLQQVVLQQPVCQLDEQRTAVGLQEEHVQNGEQLGSHFMKFSLIPFAAAACC
ncbi:hypothetical protein GPALN_006272 [Globodera pallida]|nr:hypothetical protein GPALN_006272 [Globodera pallida]